MRLLYALATIVFLYAPAYGYSCAEVKSFVATHSYVEIAAAAVRATPDERAQARSCYNATPGSAHPTTVCADCKTPSATVSAAKQPKGLPPKPTVAERKGAGAPSHATHAAPGPVAAPAVKVVVSEPADLPHGNNAEAAPEPVPQEEPMSLSPYLIPAFALLGAFYFAYCVGKYGLVPVWTKLRSAFASGAASVASLEARVKALEQATGRPAVPSAPPPTPGIGG